MDAAVRAVNAAGGVEGRPLKLIFCNGQNDPNIEAACTRSLISDGVVATVKDLPTANPAEVTALLQQAGVPEISPSVFTTAQFNSSNVFPIDGGSVYEYAGLTAFAVQHGATKLAVPSIEGLTQVTAPIINAISGVAAKDGAKIVEKEAIPETPPTFSSYATAILDSGAQGVLLPLIDTQIVGLVKAYRQLGGSPNVKFYDNEGGLTSSDLAALGSDANSIVIGGPVPPITATAQFPVLNQLDQEAEAEKASGDGNIIINDGKGQVEIGWLMVHAFADILNSAHPASITPATVLQAFDSAQNVQLGLIPPWSPGEQGPAGYSRVANFAEYFSNVTTSGQEILASTTPLNSEPLVP